MAKENNKDRILKLLKECKNHQTAESIAVQLNIQRNTASGILNELVREGIVQKEKTRPVIFSYIQPEDQLPEDPFTTFIGADQSLKDAVEKCKLSAGYPNKGMPILLFGSSGVGKSLLAEYIYQYAKFIGTIPEDAPFVVLNCADYANNKELLSSVLFGYKKGAFTGANKDTKGLIEEADKGYLFLDEVHRLSPEGQEKLFRYMDKGIISRMGDSGQNCELNVRLIFATTEGRETMLDTFLRRIPVDVVLPDFQERTLEEKYELILFLIHQESKTMNTTFQVSSNVINRLLTFQGKGNIGTLKNIIRLSCAKAYNERSKGQEVIPLNLSHLSSDTLLHGNGESIPYINEMIEVSPDQDAVWKISMTEQADVDFSEKVINDLIQEYLEKDISTIKFRKIIYDEVNRIEDIVIDQEIHPYVQNLYTQAVRNILIYLQDNYGLKYSGVMEMVFVKMLYVLNNQNKHTDDRKYEHLAKQLQRVMYRYYKMGLIFYEMLHQAVDYETNPWFVRMFAMLYFYSIARDEMDYTNAIIVSHGPATASSITSTVNKVFETYIFEAFDMEYDTPKKDVVKRIKRYLKNTNTSKGLLIFVDMGSLLDISEDIKDDVEGDLGIVNNITVQLIEVLSVFKNMFLGLIVEDEDNDPVATYRLTEFEVLTDIHEPNRKSKGLEFNEIIIPNSLQPYFKTIKQVNTVSLTNTQLGFGRVNMPTSKLDDSGKIVAPGDEMKPIFDGIPSDIYVLPANQIYGEGLFFAFDMATIERWAEENDLNDHYKCQLDNGALGEFLYQEISLYGRAKFYLLHTFSHVLMKELEFTCGYPTASLSERLYYSDKMCGVLIYTADGAEGSMGGLVWQGQPRLISSIIESAMKRAVNCSSDPLCWENEDSLNRASCFGCTMVSETSCEYQNMGLDRRALVDEEYGFFKNLVGLDSI